MVEKASVVESIRTELADVRRRVARMETLLLQFERESGDGPAESESTKIPRSILIVDDDEQVRRSLQQVIELAGYNSFQAERGRDAIEILEEGEIDLLLLDIKLRGETGIEVLRILRRRQIEVPTIIISGYLSTGVTEQLMDLGIDNIMAKPFRTGRVIEEIERILAA